MLRSSINILIGQFILISTILLVSIGCEKEKKKEEEEVQIPEITTTSMSKIDQTTATSGGTILNDGGATVTARGVCWGTSQHPTVETNKTTDGTGIGKFTSNITGLTENTTYYVRAYATNSAGTAYGGETSFITLGIGGTVTDIDGNVYHTVIIGTQMWMVENLKTTKYRDGTSIRNVTNDSIWRNLTTDAYCDYENDPANSETYGRLYNWYAARNNFICPAGWHVPSDAEWTTLTTYLGGESVAGGKLKESGTTHWQSPNTGATNSSGFTALPGGIRNGYGSFVFIELIGEWWTSTNPNGGLVALDRTINYSESYIHNFQGSGKNPGKSVRCIRD